MSTPDRIRPGEIYLNDAHETVGFTVVGEDGETTFLAHQLSGDPENPSALIGKARILDVATGFEHETEVRLHKSHKIREACDYIVEHKDEALKGVAVVAGTVVLGSLFIKRHQRRH